jgi:hypothetical protein
VESKPCAAPRHLLSAFVFPDSGRTSALAPPVPEEFVAELRRHGIPFAAGQCLVDADANEAPRLVEVICTLELPLVLIFNAGV